MKKIIIITISFLILIGVISLLHLNFSSQDITGKVINSIKHDLKFKGGVDKGDLGSLYSYTKAICNETNYCQDYEIACKNGEVISKSPITGAAVQFSTNWKDPRDNEAIEKLCD